MSWLAWLAIFYKAFRFVWNHTGRFGRDSLVRQAERGREAEAAARGIIDETKIRREVEDNIHRLPNSTVRSRLRKWSQPNG